MRTFGLLLLIAGIVGCVYFSGRLGSTEPLPEGQALTVWETLHTPAGKLEVARDGSVAAAVFGLLFIAFGKDR